MKNRILGICCDGLERGGIQNVIMSIARNLGSEFQMDVIVFSEGEQYYSNEFRGYGEIFHFRPKRKTGGVLGNIDELSRCLYYETEFRKFLKLHPGYDVLHCHNYFEAASFLKVAAEYGIPVRIAHSHNVAPPKKRKNPLINLNDTLLAKKIHKYATHRVACSREAGKYLFGNDTCIVINNAIDLSKFNPNNYTSSDYSNPRFVHVGRFCFQKNQMFLLEVFREYRRLDSSATLTMVGFGEDIQSIKDRIESFGLQDCVTLLPSDSDIAEVFSNSNIMVFPSTYEGLGISLIEAQAMGVRCYVSEAIQPEANLGLCKKICLSEGAKEWARVIFEDIRKRGLKKEYVSMDSYSIDKVIEQYKELYTKGG